MHISLKSPALRKFERISPRVRSQLSETAAQASHSGAEELTFLRAREVARECEEARLLEITSEQELSDNDQGLEIFSDTSDTIKANGDSSDWGDADTAVLSNQEPVSRSRDPSGPITDLQAQLAQMRLEIARMVEETEERLDTSEEDEEEELEEEEDVSNNWHLHYASSGSESDAVEIIEDQEFSYSDYTDQET